jgi:hypothetical protein
MPIPDLSKALNIVSQRGLLFVCAPCEQPGYLRSPVLPGADLLAERQVQFVPLPVSIQSACLSLALACLARWGETMPGGRGPHSPETY